MVEVLFFGSKILLKTARTRLVIIIIIIIIDNHRAWMKVLQRVIKNIKTNTVEVKVNNNTQ